MILLVFVIIASAVKRMRLYDDAYGLTELRFYTFAIMGWMAAVFVWMGATVLTGHRSRFAIGALAAGLTMIVALHFVNPDGYIVRSNSSRLTEGKPFDWSYNFTLSADAVPELARTWSRLDGHPAEEAFAILQWQRDRLTHDDWRSWSWSRQKARWLLGHSELGFGKDTRVARVAPPQSWAQISQSR